MVTPVDVIGGIAGYSIGATYQFLNSVVAAVTSGDFAEIKRLIMTVALLWIGLLIFLRSLRMIWGVVKLAIKLLVVIGCIVVALSIYHDGLEETAATAADYGSLWMKELSKSAQVYGASAYKLLNAEAWKVLEQLDTLKGEVFARLT